MGGVQENMTIFEPFSVSWLPKLSPLVPGSLMSTCDIDSYSHIQVCGKSKSGFLAQEDEIWVARPPTMSEGVAKKLFLRSPSDIVGGLATQTQPLVPGSLTYTCHIKGI